jgi:DNA-binding NtrC family response regulator
VNQFERELEKRALRKHAGKIAPAAAEPGVSRPTLYELIENLGIQRQTRENVEPSSEQRDPAEAIKL